MTNTSRWMGWGLAAVALGAACVATWLVVNEQREAAALRAELAAAQDRAEKLSETAKQDAATIDELKEKLTGLESAQASASPDAAAGAAPSSSTLFGKIVQGLLAQKRKAPTSPDSAEWVGQLISGVSGLLASDEARNAVSISADMMGDIMYEQFFGEVALPDDVADKVREILGGNVAEDINTVLDMFRDGFDLKKMLKTVETFRKNDSDTRLREQLANVLSPEQLAQWDDVRANMKDQDPKRILEGSLMMAAPGLTPDSRTRVAEVLSEEMMAAHDTQKQVSFANLFDLQKNVESSITQQQDIYDRTQSRLEQELDPDQMKLVSRFLGREQRQAEMGMRFVNLIFNQNAPKKP